MVRFVVNWAVAIVAMYALVYCAESFVHWFEGRESESYPGRWISILINS